MPKESDTSGLKNPYGRNKFFTGLMSFLSPDHQCAGEKKTRKINKQAEKKVNQKKALKLTHMFYSSNSELSDVF